MSTAAATNLRNSCSAWATRLRLTHPEDRPLVSGPAYSHPAGRKAVFVGDLVDAAPAFWTRFASCGTWFIVDRHCASPANHDMKLMRKLRGKGRADHARAGELLAEIDALPNEIREPFCKDVADFLDGLVSHYVFDDGKLVVAHAGMKQGDAGAGIGQGTRFRPVRETTGETDEFGLPVRYNWAAEYRGSAMVVYGHTPVPEPEWLNRTVNIDTGCGVRRQAYGLPLP